MFQKIKTFIMQDSKRVWSAIVMIVVLATVLWLDNDIVTWGFMGVLYLIAISEAMNLYQTNYRILNILVALILWIGIYFSNNPFIVALLALCCVSLYAVVDNTASGFKNIAPFVYPTLPFVAIFVLYQYGIGYLVWLICVVAIADIFAYYGGKKIGKTPLCTMSPKKTVEGALCGICSGVVIGAITGIGIFGQFYIAAIASAIIILFSILGDLFESALKRKADVKDSGMILPGHGGILDRIDAILFGCVAMLFIISILAMYQIEN